MNPKPLFLDESLAKSGESALFKVEQSRSSHSTFPKFTSGGTVFPRPDRLGGYLRPSVDRAPSKSIMKRMSKSFPRKVSFDCVDVREYDRTLGDNPSCRSGPPLSLDWAYTTEVTKKVDDYELERSSQRASQMSQLIVNKYKRRNILTFMWGHTEEEMKKASRQIKHIRRQRAMTEVVMPFYFIIEVCISIKNPSCLKKKEVMFESSSRNLDAAYVRKMRHSRSETQETFDLSSLDSESNSA